MRKKTTNLHGFNNAPQKTQKQEAMKTLNIIPIINWTVVALLGAIFLKILTF